jgi:hypothetical protein
MRSIDPNDIASGRIASNSLGLHLLKVGLNYRF